MSLFSVAKAKAEKEAKAKAKAQGQSAGSAGTTASADANLAGFIDSLIELFNASQNAGGRPSEFGQSNNSINSSFFKSLSAQSQENIASSLQSLRGGESGLYALVLQDKLELEKEMSVKAVIEAPSIWNYLLNQIDSTNADNKSAAAISLLSFPEYYIFILSHTQGKNPIPKVVKNESSQYSFSNIFEYPIASITSSELRKGSELESGTLVKIKYENAITQEKPIIVEVVEESATFKTIVMKSLMLKNAQSATNNCKTDSELTGVTHATGDAIGSNANKSEKVIYINGDAIYPYTKDMKSAELIIFYNGIQTGLNNQQRQNTILSVLQKSEDKISNKLFLIPNGHNKDYKKVKETISRLQSEKGVSITGYKLGFWSGGAQGGKTALEQETFAKVEIADPSPPSIPANILTPGSNIFMVYNKANWGATPKAYYTTNIDKYISTIEKTGATVVTTGDSHTAIMEKAIGRLMA
jgi:hypothetical protein